MTRPANYQKYRGERQISRILTALADGPKTAAQLAELLSMSNSSARKYLRILRDAPRSIYISAYSKPDVLRGRRAPIYAIGSVRDAKEPPRQSHFALIKSDPDRHEAHKARRRMVVAIKRATAAPQPWFAALPGARVIPLGGGA